MFYAVQRWKGIRIGTVVCVRNLHMFCVHISIPLGMYQRVVFTVSESKIMNSLSHRTPQILGDQKPTFGVLCLRETLIWSLRTRN